MADYTAPPQNPPTYNVQPQPNTSYPQSYVPSSTVTVVTTTTTTTYQGSPWMSVFAYFFGWLSALIVLIVEKRERYHIFHAYQSLVISFIWTIGYILFVIIDTVAIGFTVLSWLWWLMFVFLWVLCMIKAFQDYPEKYFQIPQIGPWAKNKADAWNPTP